MRDEQRDDFADERAAPRRIRFWLFLLVAAPVVVLGGAYGLIYVAFFWKASIEDRPFDSARWKAESYEQDHSSRVRQEMLVDLLENHLLSDTPEQEVLDLLGEPRWRGPLNEGVRSLTYWTGPGRLVFYLIDAEFLSIHISDTQGVFRTKLYELD